MCAQLYSNIVLDGLSLHLSLSDRHTSLEDIQSLCTSERVLLVHSSIEVQVIFNNTAEGRKAHSFNNGMDTSYAVLLECVPFPGRGDVSLLCNSLPHQNITNWKQGSNYLAGTRLKLYELC